MLISGLIDIAIDTFGGYNPAVPPQDLPSGASPNCQDVVFPEASVCQRGGLRNLDYALPGNASVNGLKTFISTTLQNLLIVFDSLGNLYNENPQGTLNLIAQRPYSNLMYQSQTLFGREYIALGNAMGGVDFPLQYDGVHLDRVSQCGPGVSPTVINANVQDGIFASPNGLLPLTAAVVSLSQSGNLVTVTIGGNNFLESQIGDVIAISGNVEGYDGSFPIVQVVNPNVAIVANNASSGLPNATDGLVSTGIVFVVPIGGNVALPGLAPGVFIDITGATDATFDTSAPTAVRSLGTTGFYIYLPANSGTPSGGGSAIIAGEVSAGLHGVSVAFVTRQGAITKPSPPNYFEAAGGLQAMVSQIPIGPSNVVARLLLFTPVIVSPATTGTFYSITSSMLINDNVSTMASVNFLDAVLISGFNGEYLFSQVELGASDTFTGYSQRTAWIGEQAKLQNILNLEFGGGWNLGGGLGGSDVPLGWTNDPTYGANGARVANGGIWQDAYTINGDGTNTSLGMIEQSAFQDYLMVPIFSGLTAYSVRFRAKISAATPGNLVLDIFSPTVGVVSTASASLAGFGSTYRLVTQAFSVTLPSIIPADALMRLYINGGVSAGVFVTIDSIEPFATLTPYNFSTTRMSYAFNPEGFSSTTGQIQIRPGDGQALQAAFTLRNTYYLLKDHYWASATDDGVNEPASWQVVEISSTIGCCGGNALDSTEEWAVVAERSGMYLFWGADPVKITPEIQEDASKSGKIVWNSINWAAGHTIWVRIDKVNKRILCGAPVNGATSPNMIFVLDYKWLDNAQDIASSPGVTYSQFTGKILCHGRGRRWILWNITANCMTFAERTDGTAQPFFGNGVGNGKVYQQYDTATQTSDDGAPINGVYQTAYIPGAMDEQALQLSVHRKKLGMLKWRAIGSGSMGIQVFTANRVTVLRSYTLSLTPAADSERSMSISAERFSFEIQTNAVGQWWQLEKWIACMKKDASILVRGGNQ